jgi:hypothetical protein
MIEGMSEPMNAETNEWKLRHAANGLAALEGLHDLPKDDAEAVNFAYQQLLSAANKIGSPPDSAPDKMVRVWTGTEWVQIVNHGWDTSRIVAHNPEDRVLVGDMRTFYEES